MRAYCRPTPMLTRCAKFTPWATLRRAEAPKKIDRKRHKRPGLAPSSVGSLRLNGGLIRGTVFSDDSGDFSIAEDVT